MNKRILIWIIIGVVLMAIWFIIEPFLIQKEPIEELTLPQITPQPVSKTPIFGIYEVCSDIEDCNPEKGIEKIKETGANAVIITVIDEEGLESVAYYPSKYLPIVEDVPDDYLKRIIESAHKNKIKVYASINLPHNYWLTRHPDWIAVWSNGEPADTYEDDYFHRIVPPSRIISEDECKSLLKNIIEEVISYGVDGIDINDNFQFSDEYLEESDTTLYSSFDNFTIEKFEQETNLIVEGDTARERAKYIENNLDIYKGWLEWRAKQVTQLLKILKTDIPFRPHLLTYGNPYEYCGLDYKAIAKELNVLYLMITPDEPKEKYFEIIKQAKNTQAKKIIASTYLFEEEDWSVVERDEEKILERIEWLKQAGADEIYVYDFNLIEKGELWIIIKNIFDKIKNID